MKSIKLSYHPRDWAKQFHASTKRYMVLVVHRRAGKTTAALNFMQVSAIRNGGRRYAYIAPTYKQAKLISWEKFLSVHTMIFFPSSRTFPSVVTSPSFE